MHVNNGTVVQRINRHVHNPNLGKILAYGDMGAMKRCAESSDESTGRVLSSQIQSVDDASQSALPTIGAMKQWIRRVRKKHNCEPLARKSLSELNIPVEFTKYFPAHHFVPSTVLYNNAYYPVLLKNLKFYLNYW